MLNEDDLDRAAKIIAEAGALLVGAGAGMGVDSGLPDFRGDEGFWKAYPPYRHLDVAFTDMASPRWFRDDPPFGWGFYGHRRNLYRETQPHAGFEILLRWGKQMRGEYFVFTSNVDGQFQKAGFGEDRIVECHGAIDWNQCMAQCGAGIVRGDRGEVQIDTQSMRAKGSLPSCPQCGALARPNILMFGDFGWEAGRESAQAKRMREWLLAQRKRPLVVVECGAGTAIPSVRATCEHVAGGDQGTLIRINPREPGLGGVVSFTGRTRVSPANAISFAAGALETLRALDERVTRLQGGAGIPD